MFAAGGGGLPFVGSRIGLADQALGTELFVGPLRNLSFDTAQCTTGGALAAMRAFVRSPQQILYGTDWPLVDAPSSPGPIVAGDPRQGSGTAAAALFPSISSR